MTKEEFLKKAQEDSDWAPGWDIIDTVFDNLYPNQKPKHYGTDLAARAIFGGNQFLDGYSIYTSDKGYQHIVTYGMTELYVEEKAFGKEWNKWGYEMTFKLKEKKVEDCLWAMTMLGNLARYTYTSKKYLAPLNYIAGNGKSLHTGSPSKITALIVIHDTEAPTQENTVYGKTEFLQLFGITENELKAIERNPKKMDELIEKVRVENPDFVTDMKRTKSYVK